MVLQVTFNNIAGIPWRWVLLVEYPEKTTDLSLVTDKLDHLQEKNKLEKTSKFNFKYISFNMVSTYIQHGVYLPSTWCLLTFRIASTYLQHGVCLPSTWRLLTFNMDSTYLQHGVYLPSTWCLLTFNMASTCLQHGVYLPSTWRLLTFNIASTYL